MELECTSASWQLATKSNRVFANEDTTACRLATVVLLCLQQSLAMSVTDWRCAGYWVDVLRQCPMGGMVFPIPRLLAANYFWSVNCQSLNHLCSGIEIDIKSGSAEAAVELVF